MIIEPNVRIDMQTEIDYTKNAYEVIFNKLTEIIGDNDVLE